MFLLSRTQHKDGMDYNAGAENESNAVAAGRDTRAKLRIFNIIIGELQARYEYYVQVRIFAVIRRLGVFRDTFATRMLSDEK